MFRVLVYFFGESNQGHYNQSRNFHNGSQGSEMIQHAKSVSICVGNKIFSIRPISDILQQTQCAPQIVMVSIKNATSYRVQHFPGHFLFPYLQLVLTVLFLKVQETSVLSFISFTTNCRQRSCFSWQALQQHDSFIYIYKKKIKPFQDRLCVQ